VKFKVKISQKEKDMDENLLKSIVGDYIISRAKEEETLVVPVIQDGETFIFEIKSA
tara:strand:+ start:126 stop:293 length:168 start_codon:yes stop_codon:yes gene_type:complete